MNANSVWNWNSKDFHEYVIVHQNVMTWPNFAINEGFVKSDLIQDIDNGNGPEALEVFNGITQQGT